MMTLINSLEKTVQEHPNRVAIVANKEEITYANLHQKSSALAQTIINIGIQKGDRVGFLFNKSLESVISIYGIMMAGACYVPLDIKSPKERIQSILNDCAINLLITSKSSSELDFLSTTQVSTIITNKESGPVNTIPSIPWSMATAIPSTTMELPKIKEEDVSYILYTSGTTGVPKGIVHTHKSAYSFAKWGAQEFLLTEKDVVSNHAPYHFDLSTFDLFASCLVGAKVVIIPEVYTKFPASIVKLIVSQKISVWYSVPSALVQMLVRGALDRQKAASLRVVLFAGEEFPIPFLQGLIEVLDPSVILSNLYGPTETNVCTFYTLDPTIRYVQPLPIGILCKDFEYKIIDENKEEVAVGTQGELVVDGPHVMQGYWNRADLNNKAFIKINQSNYYRTGDFVKLLPDATLSFLGRKDRQIKLRGFRVELDAIEHILQNIPGVQEVAVYIIEENGNQYIKASLAVVEEVSKELVFKNLNKHLPPYAVPSKIDMRQELPKTSSGKIDRQKLMVALV